MAHIMTKLGMCSEKMKMQAGVCFFFSFYQIPLVLGPTLGIVQARGPAWRRGLPTWPRDTAVGSGWSCLLSSRSPFLPHGGRWGSAHICLMPVLVGGGCRGCGAPEEGQEGPSQLWPEFCPLSQASQPVTRRPGEQPLPGPVPGLLRIWFGSSWAAAPGLAAAGAQLTLHHRRMTAGTVGVHYRDHELLEVI